MADISTLKGVLDAYGVGVRAGVITPQTDDEVQMRVIMGLPVMSDAVAADWAESGGVRHPITLAINEDGSLISGDE
jgi:hypothetical protein